MKISIKKIKITSIVEDGSVLADRVCVDLHRKLKENEGLLVGNYNRGLFLINNERGSSETPYEVAPRPFRVNAGVVSAYVYMSDGKMKYLCELKSGDRVLTAIPNKEIGEAKMGEAIITRTKTEPRPVTLIRGRSTFSEPFPIESDEDAAYFSMYRQIFKFIDPDTKKQVPVNMLREYKKERLDIEMDVSTFVQTAETVRLVKAPEREPIPITSLEVGMEVYASITNPTLKSRHFGTEYAGFCLEV